MQRSIVERMFPKPKQPLLPQYDERLAIYQDDEEEATSSRIAGPLTLSNNASRPSTSRTSTSRNSRRSSDLHSQTGQQSQLQQAPLSASILHHDDPFLAVDRAAANLQQTIQSLLDFQSQALNGRHRDEQNGTESRRSLSPSVSRTSYSDAGTPESRSLGNGTTPIRQPKVKKTTLQVARRGLVRSMQEFATLKDEELKITDAEITHRRNALSSIAVLDDKREAVQHELTQLQERSLEGIAASLRSEARTVEQEIHELEGRLLELKARHRHLTSRATQVENTAASELSSYQATLALIDKDTRSFLRRPPVKQSLNPRNASQADQAHDIYALRPERRTLVLAKDQWAGEIALLEHHRNDTKQEQEALSQGATIWKEIVTKIVDFEHDLRGKMKAGNAESTDEILASMDETVRFLHERLSQAESNQWSLLICAISAELDAFTQARAVLAPDESPIVFASTSQTNGDTSLHRNPEEDDSGVPHADLLSAQSPELFSATLASENRPATVDDNEHASRSASNESLKATLRDFPTQIPAMLASKTLKTSHSRNNSASNSRHLPQRPQKRQSESEDDDPGPDFLLSH